MKKSDKYWFNAAIYVLLGNMFSDGSPTFMNVIASGACIVMGVGYFAAMIWVFFKGESK